MNFQIARGLSIAAAGAFVVVGVLQAQSGQSNDLCAVALPKNLRLSEPEPQAYKLTTIWHNRDPYGNATGKYIIHGSYTRALPNDTVRWDNIMIEVFGDPDGDGADTLRFPMLQGFSYKPPEDLAKPDLFAAFPRDESQHLLKTLAWDAIAFEVFSWDYFDQLRLNQEVRPANLEGATVEMAGWGTIRLKDLRLRWVGISEMNDKRCAVIEYKSFVNPVKANPFVSQANGRSLYWGNLYVSLENKQIEFATMNEDIIMEIATPGSSVKKILNIQREVIFERD